MMARYVMNHAGIREYLKSGQAYPGLERFAIAIEQRAKASAKVETAASAAAHGRTPGEFRDSITHHKHIGPNRVIAEVQAKCPGCHAIEARDRTLGRAAY